MSSYKDASNVMKTLQKAVEKIGQYQDPRRITMPIEIVISENKEKAIERAEYENYMKTGEVRVTEKSREQINEKATSIFRSYMQDVIVRPIRKALKNKQ